MMSWIFWNIEENGDWNKNLWVRFIPILLQKCSSSLAFSHELKIMGEFVDNDYFQG